MKPSRSSATAGPMAASRSSRSTGDGSCRAPAGCRPISAANSRSGWLNWLGAESLGVLVAILNLIWVPIVAFADIAIPDKILTLPIIASFVVSLVHFVALYRLRVQVKAGQMLGAMIAAMSVQWTVSRAVAQGLITEHLPFARTSKGGLSRMSIEFQAFWEAVIGVLLLVGAAVLVVTNSSKQVREIYIFAGRAGAGKPAVPVGGRDRHPGELAHQLVRVLAQQRGADGGTDRAAPGRDADGGQPLPAGDLGDSPGSELTAWPDFCRGIGLKNPRLTSGSRREIRIRPAEHLPAVALLTRTALAPYTARRVSA